MNSIDFKYAIGRKVIIKDIQAKGTVNALLCSGQKQNLQYEVIYWIHGDRFQQWVNDFEIEPA
jgi:hypothetical protein